MPNTTAPLPSVDLLPAALEDSAAFGQYPNLGFVEVGWALLANAAFALCCLVAFDTVRRRAPAAFSPKRRSHPHLTPPSPSARPLGWVGAVLSAPDGAVLRRAGFDALVMVRVMRLGRRLFATFAPFALLVLVPLNVRASRAIAGLSPYDRCSLSAVPARSPLLWAHVAALYLLTFVAARELTAECRVYARLRHRYLSQPAAHARTVFVVRIPGPLRASPDRLYHYFDRLVRVCALPSATRTPPPPPYPPS